MVMPMCMACSVCSLSLAPIGRVLNSRQSLSDKRSRSCGRRSDLGPLAPAQELAGNIFPLKSGIIFSSPSPHDKRNETAGLVVARAEGSGNDGSDTSTSTTTRVSERSAADVLVDGMTFIELCDEFQCVSSPAVEATARLLVRDILELRDGDRTLANYAIFVKYKDPLRSFKGRNKYKRPSWIRTTLDKPNVAVQEMVMLSTSLLNVKWTVRGKPKLPPASLTGGELVLSINSTFSLNQISGQVTEQVDEWDLSRSSVLAQAYFWATRLSYSAVQAGKDVGEAVAGVSKMIDKGKDDDKSSYYPDPLGDPRKFFQVDENPQRDFYQVGLVIALIYLLVQFLKLTL